ncbi:Dephospho-CoA kinase [uncultured Desulfobacterium sp.]|uniref:Dephospho-CoA kinase n=1 Tax=uncultured Desulfobacterium sp. TaxID=201089 RepID=A0A445N483_9BACT|nr:Dephospho-CoA kinase [uncultured Desulfobacterium sp.]
MEIGMDERNKLQTLAKTVGESLEGLDNCLLIGVTGGIACGKSTITDILVSLGAFLIDYDVIARQVVEPDLPAWKDIVDYFGCKILNPDRTIDRKALGRIVFQDSKKRKKLESFTHPRIHGQFIRQLKDNTARRPGAITLVSIPLMVEQDLQGMFDYVLVVYIPQEKQLERLIARDGIKEEDARRILDAQMPIDEKLGYADFVINNSGSLEESKRQAEDLWRKLTELQERAGQ